ncbi:YncE family protein [Pilimelia columellifera]|uniref:YncE family protein n=1 Tax=Pilimelia columellifera subsp. columellifera TaxID=706583 RepID=A0ABP6A9G9_9ACTN
MPHPHATVSLSRRSILAGAVVAATAVTLPGAATAAPARRRRDNQVQVVTDGSALYELAAVPSLGQVFVGNPWRVSDREPRRRVFAIDGDASAVVGEIDLGQVSPFGLTAHPTKPLLYAGDQLFTRSVVKIDARGLQVTAGVTLDGQPRGMAVNPATGKLYVTLTNQGQVAVLDARTLNLLKMITIGPVEPAKVAVNPETNRVYVANAARRADGTSVSVIDGDTDQVIDTVPVEPYALGIAVNPVTGKVYVSNYASGTVSVLDGGSHTVVGRATVGEAPVSVEANPLTNRIYVAHFTPAGGVSIIDSDTHTVRRVDAVPATLGLAIDATRDRVYAASQTGGVVAAVDLT